MLEKCYIVRKIDVELLDMLNEYGFDYWCDNEPLFPDTVEITIQCCPHEIPDLEDILAPYV